MGSTLSFKYKDAIPTLHAIADTTVSYTKILSTISILKVAQQIAFENNIPVSSAYQKH
jgi:hypothetical protein